jgi:anti-sigma factor ChrR (cupin superfamily)
MAARAARAETRSGQRPEETEMATTETYVPKPAPGAIIVHSDDIAWTSFPMPGTDFKLLHLDEPNAGATYLLRVGAGEQSVLHKHLGAVEVYTVSGGWRYQEGEMWEGSYAYEPNGVIHEPEQTKDEPLILFIVQRGPIQVLAPDGETHLGLIDNELLYSLAKANGATAHLDRSDEAILDARRAAA